MWDNPGLRTECYFDINGNLRLVLKGFGSGYETQYLNSKGEMIWSGIKGDSSNEEKFEEPEMIHIKSYHKHTEKLSRFDFKTKKCFNFFSH